MPELPEVETMCRGIARAAGAVIDDVRLVRCQLKPLGMLPGFSQIRKRCRGRRIVAIERAGKRVVLRMEQDYRLVFEPRMTGLVLVADPPNQTHLRLIVQLSQSPLEQILYWDRRGLGRISCLSADEYAVALGDKRLGPDALQLSAKQLQARLALSRRAIKVALLDQRAVAGIGNLYASEILHLAGINPTLPCCALHDVQWRRLHAATRSVLQKAIRYEGSTLSDGTYRNALNQAGGYQNHHRVYDRQGTVCTGCNKAVIQRIVQAQRSTFYCPICQPVAAAASP